MTREVSPHLELDGVLVAYGANVALHTLSLAVRRGEFFCLLGPSGCGKSTTLNVVAGFLRVSGGRVLIAGEDVTWHTPQQRRLGIVFQSYALFPHMTVAQNIGYGLRLQKRPPDEIGRRVAELLALVRLEGKGERTPREISGGEQQRVALARALAIEPRLLLLDEPLSNLDARLREEMRTELKRIQRTTGVTTIFVTHDQEEAFGAADRIAVLSQGRLEQVGTPDEIYRAPRSQFVARFIGRSNKITVDVDPSDSGGIHASGVRFHSAHRPAKEARRRHVLFLRPEELQLGAAVAGPNVVTGTVIEIVHGASMMTVRIATPLGDLEACRLRGSEGLAAGTSVQVGWAADAGCLLPDEHGG